MSLRDNNFYGTWGCPGCQNSELLDEMDVDPNCIEIEKTCSLCGSEMIKFPFKGGPGQDSFSVLPVFPGVSED